MGKELIVLCVPHLPGTVEVPMATGRPKAAFVLDLVRRTDPHRGGQLDRSLQRRTRKPEKSALGEADCRTVRRAEPLITWRRPRSEPHARNNRLRSSQGVRRGQPVSEE